MGNLCRLSWIVVGLAWAAPCFAQQTEDSLLGECYALRRQSRHLDAFARCDEALRVSHTSRALAQLALTEIALERWTDAATHLAAALGDRQHPWVQQNRASLDEAMTRVRAHVGELLVEANEPGAVLTIDGRALGALPLASGVFLAPGSVRVEVRSPAGETVQRAVTLRAGLTSRESITFVRVQAPTAVATPVGVATLHAAPTFVAVTPGRPSLQRTLAWAAGGAAVASFGVALLAWRVREGVVSDFAATCPSVEADDATLARCGALHTQTVGDAATWQTVATVGLVAGGVFAAASAVLFVTSASSRANTLTSLRCGPGPGTVGMQCALRF